jgi:hypothetical protein
VSAVEPATDPLGGLLGDPAASAVPPAGLNPHLRQQIATRWSEHHNDGAALSVDACRVLVEAGCADVRALLAELDRLEVILLRARSLVTELEAVPQACRRAINDARASMLTVQAHLREQRRFPTELDRLADTLARLDSVLCIERGRS